MFSEEINTKKNSTTMKKERLFFITVLAAALLLFSGLYSCNDKPPIEEPKTEEPEEPEPPIPEDLKGTIWKLSGSVNVETGELREFQPTACAECFTLTFHSDHEASGLSVTAKTAIDLLDLRKYRSTLLMEATWSGDPSLRIDGDHFRDIMVSIESFTVTTEELKLYHNNKTEYLLFKRIQA
jgi:hypothetical protein